MLLLAGFAAEREFGFGSAGAEDVAPLESGENPSFGPRFDALGLCWALRCCTGNVEKVLLVPAGAVGLELDKGGFCMTFGDTAVGGDTRVD